MKKFEYEIGETVRLKHQPIYGIVAKRDRMMDARGNEVHIYMIRYHENPPPGFDTGTSVATEYELTKAHEKA